MCGSMVDVQSPTAEIRRGKKERRKKKKDRNHQAKIQWSALLVHGQVTIIFVVSVCLSVCLFVCLFVYAEFFSAVFDPIWIKLGHMLHVRV